jgi:hypothetical protein
MFIYPVHNHNWRNISTIYIYITRLASNEIFSPSNRIHREVGRAKDLSALLYVPTKVALTTLRLTHTVLSSASYYPYNKLPLFTYKARTDLSIQWIRSVFSVRYELNFIYDVDSFQHQKGLVLKQTKYAQKKVYGFERRR